uniref:Uncharacterized protein n=1 Tax=Romanomermis culicivorax TaxID=13658 RepID=A0A915IQS5_ROMCU
MRGEDEEKIPKSYSILPFGIGVRFALIIFDVASIRGGIRGARIKQKVSATLEVVKKIVKDNKEENKE